MIDQLLNFRKMRTTNSECGNSSVGRARPCQGRGREFEPRFPLQILNPLLKSSGFFFIVFSLHIPFKIR